MKKLKRELRFNNITVFEFEMDETVIGPCNLTILNHFSSENVIQSIFNPRFGPGMFNLAGKDHALPTITINFGSSDRSLLLKFILWTVHLCSQGHSNLNLTLCHRVCRLKSKTSDKTQNYCKRPNTVFYLVRKLL